ncbi:hypothetical protein JB92DRAFT_607554 [Gautieria morchelliformis]|nr:hypothetical protein JB92DRAFT_607554 [Gautieria morchelliformis]
MNFLHNALSSVSRPPSTDMQPFDSAEMLESQRLMMQDQDTHLDSLHSSLTRQHSLSRELSSELDVQAGLLTALDDDVDNTTSRVGRARRSLDKVGQGLGANGSTVTIAVLIMRRTLSSRRVDSVAFEITPSWIRPPNLLDARSSMVNSLARVINKFQLRRTQLVVLPPTKDKARALAHQRCNNSSNVT